MYFSVSTAVKSQPISSKSRQSSMYQTRHSRTKELKTTQHDGRLLLFNEVSTSTAVLKMVKSIQSMILKRSDSKGLPSVDSKSGTECSLKSKTRGIS
jgi:hypothetical protein